MNYNVNKVDRNTKGNYGFSIVETHSIMSKPLIYFEYEHEDKALEAHRVIGQAIAIAIKIKPYMRVPQ
jgi:hypothetical protein